jgi:hypothetical protein
MTLSRVKDHIDIISSDYFRELIRRYLDRFDYYLAFHPDWRTLYDQMVALPEPKYGDPVRPRYINVLADSCEKMCGHHGIAPPTRLRRVSNLMWTRADDVNALVDCIETLEKLPLPAPDIYLFNMHDWGAAKQYVTDYAIIFCTFDIDTLTPSEVSSLVANRKVVFVIEVDTEPYHGYSAPAWYGVFYTTLAPPACGYDINAVTDPDFQKFFGSYVPILIDYSVDLSRKVSGAKNWAQLWYLPTCGWSYKRYASGAIIEVPCDGIWKDADWLGKYVDAISSILLGVRVPTRILYLGDYISDTPSWHACYPCDECWKALAQARGWKVIDLRS